MSSDAKKQQKTEKKESGPTSQESVQPEQQSLYSNDPRITWFEERVLNALKLKSDKWKKLALTPEYW